MKYLPKIILLLCLATYVILGLSTVFLADLFVSDENWHFAASSLVSHGELPYQDFAYFHMPILPYFYGIFMFVFGPNLIIGRLVSSLLGFLTIIFVYLAATRLKGEYAGILAVLPIVFNFMVIYYSTSFWWGPLQIFFLSLFCFCLVTRLNSALKYSLCTILLVFTQGVRYGIDYLNLFIPLFIIFLIYLNKNDKKVIFWVILSFFASFLLIYLPGLLLAPKAFLFDTLTHYFYKGFLFNITNSTGTVSAYTLPIYLYDRIKQLLILSRDYYIIILLSLIAGFYGIRLFLFKLRNNEGFLSVVIRYNIYFILSALVFLNCTFYLVMFYHHLNKFLYYCFPALAILIGCGLIEIIGYLKTSKEKLFSIFLILTAVILNLFTQDIESNIASPQYAGVKFLKRVSSAIQRHTNPEDKVFSFMNGYVLQAHRQICLDTVYDISSVSLFPRLSNEEASDYKLLSPNILLDYFKEKKTKLVVLERPGRWDALAKLVSNSYKDEIEAALLKNYTLVEQIYKYPPDFSNERVDVYLAK